MKMTFPEGNKTLAGGQKFGGDTLLGRFYLLGIWKFSATERDFTLSSRRKENLNLHYAVD